MKKNQRVAILNMNKAGPCHSTGQAPPNGFIVAIVDMVLNSFSENDYFPSTR